MSGREAILRAFRLSAFATVVVASGCTEHNFFEPAPAPASDDVSATDPTESRGVNRRATDAAAIADSSAQTDARPLDDTDAGVGPTTPDGSASNADGGTTDAGPAAKAVMCNETTGTMSTSCDVSDGNAGCCSVSTTSSRTTKCVAVNSQCITLLANTQGDVLTSAFIGCTNSSQCKAPDACTASVSTKSGALVVITGCDSSAAPLACASGKDCPSGLCDLVITKGTTVGVCK